MIEQFNNKTILVTGGTGSIGSELVKQLLQFNIDKIIVFNRDEIKQFMLQQEIDDKRLEVVMGDIRDYDSIRFVFDLFNIDIVFHAAAMKHLVVCENEPIECVNTNIIGTNNLMRLCIENKVKRVITISTDKAASPTSVMGASKFISERITLNANSLTDSSQIFCCVRFGNVANSRGSVIPIMIHRILSGKDIWISNPETTRFIMSIKDAVNLVLKASNIAIGNGELFVLKMPSFKLGDLADVMKNRIAAKLGKEIKLINKSLTIGEKLHEDLLNKYECTNLLENDEMYIILNTNSKKGNEYKDFTESKLDSHTSKQTNLLLLDEIEKIIIEYLENTLHIDISKN